MTNEEALKIAEDPFRSAVLNLKDFRNHRLQPRNDICSVIAFELLKAHAAGRAEALEEALAALMRCSDTEDVSAERIRQVIRALKEKK